MHRMLFAIAIVVVTALALAPTDGARAQKGVPAEVVKELAPTGKLRAGINLGNVALAQKSKGGELGGVTVELAREKLGKRLGVPVELIAFQAAGRTVEAMGRKELDLAFFAIEPKRANQIAFSPPYVIIEGTYMVKDSPLKTVDDVDRPGIRIAVGLNSAYDLYLTRTIKNATIVRATEGGGANIPLFLKEKLDAAAGTRPGLMSFARTNPDMRVMQPGFQEIRQAMGTPKGREAAAHFVRDFIEEMKKNGFVADALKRSGQADATVAPPAAN